MRIARVAVSFHHYPIELLFDYQIPETLAQRIFVGSLVKIPFGHRVTWGVVFEIQTVAKVEIEKLKFIEEPFFEKPVFDSSFLSFLNFLSKTYYYPLGEVCETALPSAIRDLTSKALEKSRLLIEDLEGEIAQFPVTNTQINLNSDQQAAALGVLEGSNSVNLVYGVTGSGKTEVYLQIISEILKKGKSAIVLVPEISLTPQLTDRFEKRFPGLVANFHSGLKKTQIRNSWLEVFSGYKKIALGPRSALFAPIKNLGCIIVDEEHDGSYKQEERLRYHARDCAMALAARNGARVVLGSATPSAETLWLVQEKKIGIFHLRERAIETSKLPEILLVDLKKQIAKKNLDPSQGFNTQQEVSNLESLIPGSFFISPILREQIKNCLDSKKQSILFLNRRGLGSQQLCQACGWIMECPSCSVKLTPHRNSLLCHYCGYFTQAPNVCPSCSASDSPFKSVGVGTGAIEEALKSFFPEIRVGRLDRDSVSTPLELATTLEAFRNHEYDVLVGTQMVAKGHDFPNVTLVGILFADLGMGVPDFRTNERAFQLLLQISGRAGRGTDRGKVILQAFQTTHPVIGDLLKYKTLDDYSNFVFQEISNRRPLGYPPTGRLVLLRVEGLDLDLTRQAAEILGQELTRAVKSKTSSGGAIKTSISILGPAPAPLWKIRNKFRWQILIKFPRDYLVYDLLNWVNNGWVSNKFERKFKSRLILDVDPSQML